MRRPFEPVGEKARWRLIYDLLIVADVGDVVTYEAIGEALSLHPAHERNTIQASIPRAAQEHLEVDKRALEVVPNVGYRVVDAPAHLRLARQRQKRARRQLVKGHSTAINVDLTGVDPGTRHALEVVARAFALQMDFNRRFDVRQRQLEANVEQVTERAERSEQEIADLRTRLEKLEAT